MSIKTIGTLPMVALDEKTTPALTCKADAYAGHDKEKAYWDMLLSKRPDGQTLLGLVEATAINCDSRSSACARVPEIFQDTRDIVDHALVTIFNRKLIEKFDVTKGADEEGFPGYVKSCVAWVTGSAITDTLRKRSRTPSPEEVAEIKESMREEGVKDPTVPKYVPAVLVASTVTSKEDDELIYHGSCTSDWAADCQWSATSPEEADSHAGETLAFALLNRLPGEEGDAIRQMLAIEDARGEALAVKARRDQMLVVAPAAPAARTMTDARMKSLVVQVRKRFLGTEKIVRGL